MKSDFIKLASEYGMSLEMAETYYGFMKYPNAFLSLRLLETGGSK